VDTDSQHPCSRGCTNPLAAPRRSTEQGHHDRNKHAHPPDAHYDDYEDISLVTLANFSLRPSIPPRPGVDSVMHMVDYTKVIHDIYRERYTDPS
jgi:hypothetical protein